MKSLVLACLLGAAGVSAFSVSKTIVDLAVATPDLSTLVAALKAADLVDTLSGKGPFTVFAPTNEAFAALPAGVLANLLKPENKAQLVDILTYHVASGDVQSKDLTDMEMIKTVEGKDVQARVSGSEILINSAKVTAADNEASNGVVHIIDAVLMPGSAPKPPTPGPPGPPIGIPGCTNETCIFSYSKPLSGGYIQRCGQVNAAPRMPEDLFKSPTAIKAYIEATLLFYTIDQSDPDNKGKLKHLFCDRQVYDVPCRGNQAGPTNVPWTTPLLMQKTCDAKCNCKYPDCPDVPDDPDKGFFCSLCGPKFNAPIQIDYYCRGRE